MFLFQFYFPLAILSIFYSFSHMPSSFPAYFRQTDWMALAGQLNSAAHGHIHELIGGSWAHLFAEVNHNQYTEAILTFAHSIQAMSKEIWRAGYMSCPSSCGFEVPASSCRCQCDARMVESSHPYDILVDSEIMPHLFYFNPLTNDSYLTQFTDSNGTVYYVIPGMTYEESTAIYRNIVDTLCNPGHIGDMFQATSTNDITFWVLHPLQDRVWHMLRLADDGWFNHAWKNSAQTCYGHKSMDIQPFKNIWDDNYHFYTNAELYDYLHPNQGRLTYAYDNFDWAHCQLVGKSVAHEVTS